MSAETCQLTMLRDWRERQICEHQELPKLLTEAAQAGFAAVRLERWRNGYRITFQAMQSAADGRGARAVECNHFEANKTS